MLSAILAHTLSLADPTLPSFVTAVLILSRISKARTDRAKKMADIIRPTTREAYNITTDTQGDVIILSDPTWPLTKPERLPSDFNKFVFRPDPKKDPVIIENAFELFNVDSNLRQFVTDPYYTTMRKGERKEYILSELLAMHRDGDEFFSEAIFFARNGHLAPLNNGIRPLPTVSLLIDASIRHGMHRLKDLYLTYLHGLYLFTPPPLPRPLLPSSLTTLLRDINAYYNHNLNEMYANAAGMIYVPPFAGGEGGQQQQVKKPTAEELVELLGHNDNHVFGFFLEAVEKLLDERGRGEVWLLTEGMQGRKWEGEGEGVGGVGGGVGAVGAAKKVLK